MIERWPGPVLQRTAPHGTKRLSDDFLDQQVSALSFTKVLWETGI